MACAVNACRSQVKTAQKSANNGKKLGCAMVRAVSTEAVKEAFAIEQYHVSRIAYT